MTSGSFWPVSAASFGLGSKSSTWLVPPARKMKMQFLTRGGEVGAACGETSGCVLDDPRPGGLGRQQAVASQERQHRRRPQPAGGAGQETSAVQGQGVG